eukprot:9378314-Pyramimonas_sp.AAC.1
MHGATVDKSLPAPQAKEGEEGNWDMMEEEGEVDVDAEYFDGKWKENAAKFEAPVPLGHALALEQEVDDEDETKPDTDEFMV